MEINRVTELLREVAETVVMPRFQSLQEGDVGEKEGGELVTVVDREVEIELGRRLPDLMNSSRCVGEEACHADPDLVKTVGDGLVWLIDPVDGTRNFIAGDPNFALMVALLRDGETIASWMYAPAGGWYSEAERGSGAFDGAGRIWIPEGVPSPGVIYGRFLPADGRSCVAHLAKRWEGTIDGSGSAGCDYYRLARGAVSYILFWRTRSWDHVPGALLVEEAGGMVRRLNGDPYLAAQDRLGLLAASSDELWRATTSILNPCLAPLGAG